jgi:ribonuclease HII
MNRYHFEQQLWKEGYEYIMGLDEVGRGCLAGPVVAAGVILKPGSRLPEKVIDSKQMKDHDRRELAEIIKGKASAYVIKEGSLKLIEEKNILWASLLTMQKCVEHSSPSPDYLLIDGNRYLPTILPHLTLTKGDDRSISIAAASILAKVYRDDLMIQLHEEFPHFGWDTNVGYATKKHYAGLTEHGITRHHRRGFNLKTEKEFDEKTISGT